MLAIFNCQPYDDQKFGARDDFFFKMILSALPPFWRLKKFSHHLTYPHRWMGTERWGRFPFWAIEEFRSPSNGVGLLNGDQNFSVTIQRCRYFEWWLNFVSCLQIHPHCAMATEFFSITQKGMGESHGITIKTKWQGKKMEKRGKKRNKNKGKILARPSKGRKDRERQRKREGGGNKRRKERTHNAKSKEKGEKNKGGWGGLITEE